MSQLGLNELRFNYFMPRLQKALTKSWQCSKCENQKLKMSHYFTMRYASSLIIKTLHGPTKPT